MAYEFKLPDLGEGLTEGEVARWLVAEGQEVAEDEPLVEIQTDKTTVEIPSPAAGVVSRILVEEGAVVPVGTVLVVIGADGVARAGSEAESPSAQSVTRREEGARDAARQEDRAASSASIWRRCRGTGPQGRVTEEDVAPRGRRGQSTRDMSRRGAASPCAACGGSSPSTWRGRTARCRR